MPIYKVYPLGSSGQISGPASRYYCDNDEAALALADRLRMAGKPVGVWQASIRIGNRGLADAGDRSDEPTRVASMH